MKSYRIRNVNKNILLYLFLGIGAFITIFPFLWMIFSTFKSEAEILHIPLQIFPTQFRLDNYIYVWKSLGIFPRYLFNSVFVTGCVVILNVFFDSLAAFAFAKLKFKGKKFIFTIFLVTLLVPGQIMLIELYRVMQAFNWINTYWALIIPGSTSAFGIFLVWQYMRSIPDDFVEAARVEGANDFVIYWRIYFPLSMPALAALAIFTFIGTWNDFLWPLIVTSENSMRTITVGTALMQGNNVMHWTWLMTGAFISVAPVMLFYLFAQRYFIAGLTAGGVKG
jgi:multiple sugar transport system permease protein